MLENKIKGYGKFVKILSKRAKQIATSRIEVEKKKTKEEGKKTVISFVTIPSNIKNTCGFNVYWSINEECIWLDFTYRGVQWFTTGASNLTFEKRQAYSSKLIRGAQFKNKLDDVRHMCRIYNDSQQILEAEAYNDGILHLKYYNFGFNGIKNHHEFDALTLKIISCLCSEDTQSLIKFVDSCGEDKNGF